METLIARPAVDKCLKTVDKPFNMGKTHIFVLSCRFLQTPHMGVRIVREPDIF